MVGKGAGARVCTGKPAHACNVLGTTGHVAVADIAREKLGALVRWAGWKGADDEGKQKPVSKLMKDARDAGKPAAMRARPRAWPSSSLPRVPDGAALDE